MAVEIRELVIRATVEEAVEGPETPSASVNTREIIEVCVERVLDILRREKER